MNAYITLSCSGYLKEGRDYHLEVVVRVILRQIIEGVYILARSVII